MDSASGLDCEKMGRLVNNTDCDVLSRSGLSPGSLTNENLREDRFGQGLGVDSGSGFTKPSITRMDSFNEAMWKRSSLKTKHSYGRLLKPLSSLDSCLMAQLHMQHVKMEEYILSSVPLPATPTLRPLLITDGSRIINRASGDFSNGSNRTGDNKLYEQAAFEKNRYVHAIPPLPETGSSDLRKKLNFRSRNESEKQFSSHWGRYNREVIFCLGISIGIICSYIGNRREFEKLRGLLKQTENLVRDLQEELEMKDSSTVKDSFSGGETNLSSLEINTNNLTRFDGEESYHRKAEESLESMSKIEAELEAELERLGLNMNVPNPEPDLIEIDPDFVADFAEGELRSDMVTGQALAESTSNEDRSGTSTTHSSNYAVSPRELSLCLHEVIRSRLEERVQELETALENSQRKVKLMESERKNPNDKWKHSTTLESPPINGDPHHTSKLQVPKLSWETPDHELLDVNVSEGECGDHDDEIEKLLIQQIVEKTKKGSPVLLNAQRMLFSMDET